MLKTIGELLPGIDKQLNKEKDEAKKTQSFPTWKIQSGTLYTVIAKSNAGKTFWTWATAISLSREGFRIGVISTEDSLKDIRRWVKIPIEPAFASIKYFYLEEKGSEGMARLFDAFADSVDVLLLDYLRPDILKTHRGDLHATMGELYKIIRSALERHNFAIIQTIQANATLYKQNLGEIVEKNESLLYTAIDGGAMSAKRSQFLAMLDKNQQGDRGLYVLKAKGEYHMMEGYVWNYGSVRELDFSIRYDAVYLPYNEWSKGKNKEKPKYERVKL